MTLQSTGGTRSVGEFFNQASAEYDRSIRKAIPPYQEMFDAVLGYCFQDGRQPLSILELGCGTGNLSICLRQLFPKAHLTLVDLSADMLAQAAQKLKTNDGQTDLVESGFMTVQFQPQSFDLIFSSMALHHLTDDEKPVMYQRIFEWLKPGGLFRCADETLSLPAKAQDENMVRWEAWAKQNGATEADVAYWADHAEQYDHYAPLASHFAWLQQAGFTDVDCYWRKLMWTVFGATKP